jgi:hypothetical protein
MQELEIEVFEVELAFTCGDIGEGLVSPLLARSLFLDNRA